MLHVPGRCHLLLLNRLGRGHDGRCALVQRILPWLSLRFSFSSWTMASCQTLSVAAAEDLLGTVSAGRLGGLSLPLRRGQRTCGRHSQRQHQPQRGTGLWPAARARGLRTALLRADLELHLHRTSDPGRRPGGLEMGSRQQAAGHRPQQRDRRRSSHRLCARKGRSRLAGDPLHQRGAETRQGHRQEHLRPHRRLPRPASRRPGLRRRRSTRRSGGQSLLLGFRGLPGHGDPGAGI